MHDHRLQERGIRLVAVEPRRHLPLMQCNNRVGHWHDMVYLHALQDGKMVATIGLPSYLFGALPVVMLYFSTTRSGWTRASISKPSGPLVTAKQVPEFMALSKLGLR